MQTYGLKVGDKVKLSQNAGTHPQGFIYRTLHIMEPINPPAWEGEVLEIKGFNFINGATYVEIYESNLIATEVEKIKEKSIEQVQVGDYVTIIQGTNNWNPHMNKYVGKTVKVTAVKDHHYDKNQKVIEFNDYGKWVWETKNKHFRFATEEEIAKLDQVVIKFGEINLSIVKGSGKATSPEGDIKLTDVEEILDSVEYPKKELLGYAVTFIRSDDTIVCIGCQKDTLAKVKEIYKVMRG